jgi:hypothetical protein
VILDSLALRYASVLRTIEALTGREVAGIHDYLNQATANAAGGPGLAGRGHRDRRPDRAPHPPKRIRLSSRGNDPDAGDRSHQPPVLLPLGLQLLHEALELRVALQGIEARVLLEIGAAGKAVRRRPLQPLERLVLFPMAAYADAMKYSVW